MDVKIKILKPYVIEHQPGETLLLEEGAAFYLQSVGIVEILKPKTEAKKAAKVIKKAAPKKAAAKKAIPKKAIHKKAVKKAIKKVKKAAKKAIGKKRKW